MDSESIYDDLGVPRVVNATGTKTRIGGSLIRPECVEAMADAATAFARISDLQARASELIADVTTAEAGYVTAGADAGLLLGAAAAIAGYDYGVMDRLPDTCGEPNEIIMPRTHRTGYDHAFRAAGGKIVDVGTNDRHLGTGSSNTELWEIEDAISERTAAIGYVQKPYLGPPLPEVSTLAHEYDVPVIVDAAAELPPAENLSRFIDEGADLVVFSGGKAIRGPQTTGIVAGKRHLIESIALQHLDMHAAEDVWMPPSELVDPENIEGVPRQGIGRPHKVGKEELVGLIRALELFVEEDHATNVDEWEAMSERMAEALEASEHLATVVTDGDGLTRVPEVVVRLTTGRAAADAAAIVAALRSENPRVFVGADRLERGAFTINPMCLAVDEDEYVVEMIEEAVRRTVSTG